MSSLIDETSNSVTHSASQLYLLRHGETDWNVQKRLQGRTDTSLNDKGRAQAQRHGIELAKELHAAFPDPLLFEKEIKTWSFVSSPLKRCRETMEIVLSALELSPHLYEIDERLLEISFGDWEGKSWAELRDIAPQLVQARFDDPWENCARGAETYTDLDKRVLSWYSSLSKKTIAVTHSGPSRIVRAAVSDLPKDEILKLDSPQDKFIRVNSKGFEWI